MTHTPLRRFSALRCLPLLAFSVPVAAHTDILAPNGGEVFATGSVVSIQWTILIAHGQNDWDLWYSTTGPNGPWIPIAMNLPPGSTAAGSTHTYDWTVPNTPSNDVYVRVRMDNSGTDYEGFSDGAFSIVPAAQATVRNGSGVNPVCLASTTLPVLGGSWTAQVDHSQHPGATFTAIFVHAAPAAGSILSIGELLVSGPQLFVTVQASTGTFDVHTTPVPNNLALAGALGYAQGLVLGGGTAELCNAVDLVVGL